MEMVQPREHCLISNDGVTICPKMARRRAMFTDTERELIYSDEMFDRYYQTVSRIRRKINVELTEDVRLLEENHRDLLEEHREAVCDED